ncbi:sugar transferase [Nocardioides pacificus]
MGLVLSGLPAVLVASTGLAWVLVRAARAGGDASPWATAPRSMLESVVLLSAGSAAAAAWSVLAIEELRQVLVTTMVLAAAGLAAGWLAARRRGAVRAMVVGDAAAARRAAQGWRSPSVTVTAITDAGDPDAIVDLLDARANDPVDVVILAPGCGLAGPELRRLGWALEEMGVPLLLLDVLGPTARHRLRLVGIGGRHLLEVCPTRPRLLVRLAKCLLDRAAGLALLLLVSPLLVLLAVAVRLDSPGPAFFRQTRIGRYGRPFTMFKLRTMHIGAEQVRSRLLDANEADAVVFKIRRDPRVTRLGRLLRRSSLDEVPQLLNVVRGEMSLVGPRPALPHEVAEYDEVARRRLVVLPGITGLWQVSGRSDLDWEESVALDVHYADNLTFSGDLAIFLRTVRAVLLAKGAY